MVKDAAQLYTIEGVAASLIMIMTAFFVINATTVYTAGDSHITDMQLEILGSDALKMMNTPHSWGAKSPLQDIIEPITPQSDTFKTLFLNQTNNRTGLSPENYNKIDSGMDFIQFSASYTCRNQDNSTASVPLSSSRNLTGGEHTVRATKWVIVDKAVCDLPATKPRAVLVEVLMWRD